MQSDEQSLTYRAFGCTIVLISQSIRNVSILLVKVFECRFNLVFHPSMRIGWDEIFESGTAVVVFTIPSLVKMLLNLFIELGRCESNLIV